MVGSVLSDFFAHDGELHSVLCDLVFELGDVGVRVVV